MKDLKTPWELFGVECGEGWFSLIEPILQTQWSVAQC